MEYGIPGVVGCFTTVAVGQLYDSGRVVGIKCPCGFSYEPSSERERDDSTDVFGLSKYVISSNL